MPSLNTKLATAPNTTANYVLKATTSTTIGNSLIFDNGTQVGIGTNSFNSGATFEVYNATQGNLFISSSGSNESVLRFFSGGNELVTMRSTGTGALRIETGTGSPAERLRITSTGLVGIGTNNPLALLDVCLLSSGARRLLVNYADSIVTVKSSNDSSNGENLRLVGDNIIFNSGSSGNGSERMRITNGGSVGIGTTSPSDLLEVRGGFIRLSATSGNGPQFNLYSNGQTSNHVTLAQGFALATDNIGYLYNRANADFVFGTNNSEKMRLNSSGNLLVGKTATGISTLGCEILGNGTAVFAFAVNNNEAIIFNNINTSTTYEIDFRTNAVERGKISVTDSGVSYLSNSDYRLKEDLKDFNGLEKLTNIKVYDFKFKDLEERRDGVIAHELQEVIPYAVSGEKDGKKFQSVDYSRIVPVLIKSIQELNQQVQDQQQTINSLINR
jgi:hypothetical protein